MVYNYDNELENIDTQDKAYLLGLYYSDGFITYEKESYFSAIKLKMEDSPLLKRIVEVFPFFSYQEYEGNSLIRCNKKKFVEDLLKNGVLPNKSSTNKNKLKFPKIKSEFVSHFIRGYFDGDGSIYLSKTNCTNGKGMSITSNNYSLIKSLQFILYYNDIVMKLAYTRGGSSVIRGINVTFSGLCFNIYRQEKQTIINMSKYLYKNANLFMERKKAIFDIPLVNTLQERPICPRCDSNNTQYYNKKKGIVYCKKCKKISTLGKKYKDSILPSPCGHCKSSNTVYNGYVRSKTDKKIIGRKVLCRNCYKGTSVTLTAPLLSD